MGAAGCLSWLSIQLRLRSWSHGSWVWAPRQALCWQLRARNLLQILSPSLSAPPLFMLCLSLSLSQINIKKTYFGRDEETEHEQGRGRERGKERENPKQALHCECTAWCGDQTHKTVRSWPESNQVGCLTNWATQMPLNFFFKKVKYFAFSFYTKFRKGMYFMHLAHLYLDSNFSLEWPDLYWSFTTFAGDRVDLRQLRLFQTFLNVFW